MRKLIPALYFIFFISACSKKDPVPDRKQLGETTFSVNGAQVTLKTAELTETTLDNDEKGILAFSERVTVGEKTYVLLQFFSRTNGHYQMHKIDLNVRTKTGEKSERLEVYYAFLREELNSTKFLHHSVVNENRLSGNYSGLMRTSDPHAPKIYLAGGNFNYHLSNLKK